jgi:hypothetical protein
MPMVELDELECLGDELRDAVSRADWQRAAAVDLRLHDALRRALTPKAGAALPPDEVTLAALGRIMRLYESAMREVVTARDRVRADLTAAQAGRRGAADYLRAAGG